MPISTTANDRRRPEDVDGSDHAGPASVAELLSINDVAAMLSCSTRHVRRLIDSGLCPAPLRLSNLVRLRRTDVEQWIQDGCPRCR
ncbi:MAG: excisionase family DNA binding protein [Mariniblastus sp.]|jgi:excisionase family DNA binding protein